MKHYFSAAIIIFSLITAANAATICASGGGTNISNTGTTTCSLGDLTFLFQAPGFSPTSTGDSLTVTDASMTGDDLVLEFGINPGTSGFPVDVNINYEVTSTTADITGIDAMFPGGTTGSIFEQACTAPTSATSLCTTPDTLSSITVTTGGVNSVGTPATFGPVSSVYIHKDIDAISFSEFTDSITESPATVPEPAPWLILGSGLCLVSTMLRRFRRG